MTDLRDRMASLIVGYEARRDHNGHLAIYPLPANDGGGAYEVAGLNQKYDPVICDQLCTLIRAGKFDAAEALARQAIMTDTDGVATWDLHPAVEFFLRAECFNRGLKGVALILQHALGVDEDGDVGPITKAAADAAPIDIPKTPTSPEHGLLVDLHAACAWYEIEHIGKRANFWKGLCNRWDNTLRDAKTFI